MRKRFVLVSVALMAMAASAALAQEKGGGVAIPAPASEAAGGCCACPADPTVTGDVYVGPMNKYLFRGQDLSLNKWVMQGGVDLNYKTWTLSYWTNYQGRANNDQGLGRGTSENDVVLNYSYSPHELVTLNVGNNLFNYRGGTTFELYLKAQMNTLLTPTLTAYWDFDKSSRDGLFYSAAVSHKLVLERNLLSLTLGALASYNQRNWNAATNPNSSDPYDGAYSGFHNYELSANLDYSVTGNITVTPNYLFSNALSDKARELAGIRQQHNYGIKATFSF